MIRYQVLDRCLRNRYKRDYIKDLVAVCNEALLEYSEKNEPVKVRQIYKDLNFMEEKWSTEELLSQLEDRFALKGQSKSVIGFEQNLDYTGQRRKLVLIVKKTPNTAKI